MTEPPLKRRSDLLASGTTADEIRHALRNGSLKRIARGIYVDAATDLDPLAGHRARLTALRGTFSDDEAISHVSAAVLHGFDLWGVDPRCVHLTRDRASGGSRRETRHIHTASLRPEEICHVEGLPVTSVARTIVDLARALPVDQAVIAGDSAMRMHPNVALLLPEMLAAGRARQGIAKARRTVEFLDGRSESPGESLSRLRIHTAGLPAPVLQHELRTDSGVFVARPDFFWKDPGVVGEFDGRGKYGSEEPGATADTIHREKLREDAIRALGYEVVGWTWRELFEFDAVRARLLDAAGRARRR